MEKIRRTMFAQFMNTTPASETAVWSRMGKGVTGGTIAYNAKVTKEQYIDEENESASVDGYAPELPTTQTCYKDEPIFEFIDALRQGRALGSDLETDLLIVYKYDFTESQSTKTYRAEKQKVVIEIGDFGGDAGDPVSITYTLHFSGDPVPGSVVFSDAGAPTFTADT